MMPNFLSPSPSFFLLSRPSDFACPLPASPSTTPSPDAIHNPLLKFPDGYGSDRSDPSTHVDRLEILTRPTRIMEVAGNR